MKTRTLIITCSMLLLLTACDKKEVELQTHYEGTKVNVGDGQAWTVVETDALLNPISIGVHFTESALNNLPTGSMHADEFMLQLPDLVAVAPFDHITLDWNEHGHEPMHVYDKPHFDLHFYLMTESQRNQIGPNDEDEFNKPLPEQYLAPNYLETPGGVPRMGAHIIDLMSPEIEGSGEFTHTFIYGKYDGKVNFLEPMVTKDFLDSKQEVQKEIRQPQAWQRSGFYPKQYSISFDTQAKVYSIMLTNLTEY